MPVIDSDTHVDENEETWEYFEAKDRQYKPVTVVPDESIEAPKGYGDRWWLIDGQLRLRRVRDDVRTGTVRETRELHDIPARLRHMDELGVDIHVLYPTLFLQALTEKPEVEVALCKSYNRWLAEKCAQAGGRLRWVAMLPQLDMEATIREMRFAKETGACGVMKKGIECENRRAGDPYFYPIYEEASRLGLPICFHIGSGDPAAELLAARNRPAIPTLLDAFISLTMSGVPDRFPQLRVGFIEAGASWIPYVLSRLQAQHERAYWLNPFELKQDLLRQSRFWVAYQTQEDLPYLLEHGAEDNLVAGSDYSHADQSAELQALGIIRERGERGEYSQTVVHKILDDNPRALYGL